MIFHTYFQSNFILASPLNNPEQERKGFDFVLFATFSHLQWSVEKWRYLFRIADLRPFAQGSSNACISPLEGTRVSPEEMHFLICLCVSLSRMKTHMEWSNPSKDSIHKNSRFPENHFFILQWWVPDSMFVPCDHYPLPQFIGPLWTPGSI